MSLPPRMEPRRKKPRCICLPGLEHGPASLITKSMCQLAGILEMASLCLWGANTVTAADKKDIVIGFSQRRVAGSDWYKTLVAGATSEAKKLGVTIRVTDAGGDTVRQ